MLTGGALPGAIRGKQFIGDALADDAPPGVAKRDASLPRELRESGAANRLSFRLAMAGHGAIQRALVFRVNH